MGAASPALIHFCRRARNRRTVAQIDRKTIARREPTAISVRLLRCSLAARCGAQGMHSAPLAIAALHLGHLHRVKEFVVAVSAGWGPERTIHLNVEERSFPAARRLSISSEMALVFAWTGAIAPEGQHRFGQEQHHGDEPPQGRWPHLDKQIGPNEKTSVPTTPWQGGFAQQVRMSDPQDQTINERDVVTTVTKT